MIVGSILALRHCKTFFFYAGFYSLLLFAAITAASVMDYTGINSALLPFLILGTVVCGFISGWRMVFVYGVTAMAFVWALYYVSATAPQGALFDPTLFAARNIQRAAQISIILSLATAISAFSSYAMHSAFYKLEETVDMANRANKAKTQFMADMSHELRTPLNGMMGMSMLLLKTKLDVTQEQYAEIISKCSQNLFGILEDVLDIFKIDSDRFIIRKEAFDLQKLLNNLIDLHKPVAMGANIDIGLRYPQNLPSIYLGDKSAVRQIVNNLMGNALKFTSKGSAYINVQGELLQEYGLQEDGLQDGGGREKYQLSISVTDTGIGIAHENIDTIFERFSQLDKSLSREKDGTGLGLPISRKMAELMGGSLTVLTKPGEGSSFILTLALPVEKTAKVITQSLDLFQPLPKLINGKCQIDDSLEEIQLWAQ